MGYAIKREDLTEKKFGRLTVKKYVGNDNSRNAKWICKCECGKTTIVPANSLKNGKTKSCGCLKKERITQANRLHIAGQKFGRWTVLEDIGNDKTGKSMWKCKCSCGKESIVSGSSLKNGSSQSCGCFKKEQTSKRHRLNIVGQRFNNFLVLKTAGKDKRNKSLFLCRCNCGRETVIVGSNLVNGNSKNCGCLRKEKNIKKNRVNITGQKFGRLSVIEYAYTRKNVAYWLCHCECGSIVTVQGQRLRSGHTTSCGCLHKEKLAEIGRLNKGCIPANKGKKLPQFSGKNSPCFKHGLTNTRAYKNQIARKRKATKKNQTPADANQIKILKIYSFCAKLNQLSSKKFAVDHIQPISHGGLHHENNLQVLSGSLNSQKNNKWPLTPEEKIKYQGITLTDIEAQEQRIAL